MSSSGSSSSAAAAASVSREAYLGISSAMIIVCGVFVAVRCGMELRKSSKLVIDDYLSVFALLLTALTFAMNDYIIRRFANPVGQMEWLVDMGVAITTLIGFMLWFSKAPIFFVYIRLFGIKKWLAYSCYGTLVVTLLAYIGAMIPTFIDCHTNADPATPMDLQVCVKANTLSGVITGFIALFTDVIIFFLPMPSIYGLHLATSKKLALGAVFFSGILGIVASIVSLYYKYSAYDGKASDTLATMLCAVIEGTIAIIVGCAPATRSLWTTMISPRNASAPNSMYPNMSKTKRSNFSSDEYQMMDSGSNSSQTNTNTKPETGAEWPLGRNDRF